jgi:hypothetical protein
VRQLYDSHSTRRNHSDRTASRVVISTELKHTWHRSWTPDGPTFDRAELLQFRSSREDAGDELTGHYDVYIAVVVAVMFLAGCVLAVVDRYQRSRERKRWE